MMNQFVGQAVDRASVLVSNVSSTVTKVGEKLNEAAMAASSKQNYNMTISVRDSHVAFITQPSDLSFIPISVHTQQRCYNHHGAIHKIRVSNAQRRARCLAEEICLHGTTHLPLLLWWERFWESSRCYRSRALLEHFKRKWNPASVHL